MARHSSTGSAVNSSAESEGFAIIIIDLNELTGIVDVGVRRASAFLKLGLRNLDAPPLRDLTLNGDAAYSFWPVPLPGEVWGAVAAEYKVWLIGSCLKELDQYFSLFLDRAWFCLDHMDQSGATSPEGNVISADPGFSERTNSANKFASVAKRLNFEADAGCLASLSCARNALTHGMGQVRERDLTDKAGRLLVVQWRALVGFLIDGENEMTLEDAVASGYVTRGRSQVQARPVRRFKSFEVGEKIDLSANDLAEICMFYSRNASSIRERMVQHAQAKGIPREPKA